MRAHFRGTARHVVLAAGVAAMMLVPAVAPAAAKPAVEGYADFDGLRVQLEAVAESRFASLESLAVTRGKRDVFLLTVGTGKIGEKPALLVIGGVHPPHLLGSELAARLARRLVEGAEGDEATRKLLSRVTFYFIPRAAPDAAEAFFRRPYVERVRNDRPVDDDRDGETDEDGPDDLNGDGWITMMRVADRAGEYVAHPDDKRVMVKADAKRGEHGRWALYVEGRDNDGDEQWGEDPPGGVALNRNFTFEYPFFEEAAGPHQVSEPETRAVADFAFSHPNVAAVLCFTPEDNLMQPWEAKEPEDADEEGKENEEGEGGRVRTSLLPADAPFYELLAERYQKIHGGEDAPDSPEGKGSLSEWAYFHYGRWSLAARGWWIPDLETKEAAEEEPGDAAGAGEEAAKKKPEEDDRGADERNALRWFAREGIDGFVPWQRIEHPDFPGRRVEVGGFKPFMMLNPPAEELEPLAEKHAEFLAEVADKLPRLRFEQLEADRLGGGVWRVDATLVNRGFLPTVSEMGRISQQLHPVQTALELPEGASLVTGHARVEVPPLSGGGGKGEQSWLVRAASKGGPAVLRVRAWSPSVGSTERSIRLPNAEPPDKPKANAKGKRE